jgi:hypothetical protein
MSHFRQTFHLSISGFAASTEYKKTRRLIVTFPSDRGKTSMRTILEDMRSGEVIACEVPGPELVPVEFWFVPRSRLLAPARNAPNWKQGEKSLLGKAIARPDLVRQVVDLLGTRE